MAYTTIDDPEGQGFQVKAYTGNGSDDHSITLDGTTDLSPNLVWIKNRENETSDDPHIWFDTVWGVTKYIATTSNAGQQTDADTLDAFQTDGFKIDDDTKVNTNAEKYVAWCWKESTTAGLDIIAYTGNGSNRTISHNLSPLVPKVIICKNLERSDNWNTYHVGVGNTDAVFLNSTAAPDDQAEYWNDTDPTSSNITIGVNTGHNADTEDCIAYVFANVTGFSKHGKYVGNSSTDGKFIYTGFKVAYVMTKRIDTTSAWYIWDNKRNGFNNSNNALFAYHPSVENTTQRIDLLSNGFKFRHADSDHNGSSGSYIYMAFAESPFVNSKNVPNNAN